MSPQLVVILGGNGYLGQRIVNCALKRGANVVSISRSGLPPPNYSSPSDLSKDVGVTWHKGLFMRQICTFFHFVRLISSFFFQ